MNTFNLKTVRVVLDGFFTWVDMSRNSKSSKESYAWRLHYLQAYDFISRRPQQIPHQLYFW